MWIQGTAYPLTFVMKLLTALLLMLALAMPAGAWNAAQSLAENLPVSCAAPVAGAADESSCCSPDREIAPSSDCCCRVKNHSPAAPPAPTIPADAMAGKVAAAAPPRDFADPVLPLPRQAIGDLKAVWKPCQSRAFAPHARPCALRCSFRI